MGKSTWYTTNLGPDVANAARELAVNMSHPGPEYWKALGRLIGYIKGKGTKGIITRKPKFLKAGLFCDLNYVTYMEIIKNVSGLFDTLVGKLPTCLSKIQRTVTLIRPEAEYVALLTCP